MSSFARSINRRASREFKKLERKLRSGPQVYSVAVRSLASALADERIGRTAFEHLTACYACIGAGSAARECFACMRGWSLDRTPELVVEVEFLRIGEGMIGFICRDCAAGPDPRAAILAGVSRDLGVRHQRIIAMPDAGHA